MEHKTFIEDLYRDKPEGTYILLWTLPDKRSYWFDSVSKCVMDFVEDDGMEKDIYIGTGLSPKDYGSNKRCKAEDIIGIPGLWADIDYQDKEAHKKDNLPPDYDSAIKFVKQDIPVEPSYIIHSGHGIQVWWLFKETWIFDDKNEGQEASELVYKWNHTLRAKAQQKGWDIDSTVDLSRVFRVPGTINYKSTPVPVSIVKKNDNRYNPEYFNKFFIDDRYANTTMKKTKNLLDKYKKSHEGDKLNLSPDASPPFDKWMALRQIEPKIEKTWNRERKDLQDQSASAYDQSLCNYAVMAGWNDQEIVDLLIASRRHHGDDLKLREDYYLRTIAKSRSWWEKKEAEEQIDEVTEVAEEVAVTGDEEDIEQAREALLENISALFGVKINRIVKYLSDPPQYRLEMEAGNIMLGGSNTIMNQNSFRNSVFAATNIVIPRFKGDRWDRIVQAIGNTCVEEELGDEATTDGMARAWISDYLNSRQVLEDPNDAAITRQPFMHEGNVCLFGSSLRKWLKMSEMEKLSAKQMGAILRSYGCRLKKVNVEVDGRRTTRSVWEVPDKEGGKDE